MSPGQEEWEEIHGSGPDLDPEPYSALDLYLMALLVTIGVCLLSLAGVALHWLWTAVLGGLI